MAEQFHAAPGADPARREFMILSAAAGLAVASRGSFAADAAVESREVEIRTPDGTADAVFCCQPGKVLPGVLLWTDAFGLRPWTREMARRLAAAGYSVLVPNPFYRTDRAPQYADVHGFDFGKAEDRQKLMAHMGPLNQPGNPEKDATAYVAWLDAQKEVSKARPLGTQGYCMGGPLIMRTAAALPGRIGAAASFHGGGLVTDKPDSPHLLIPKMRAQLYIGIAANDDAKEPEAKAKLRAAFDAAKVRAEVEVYANAAHGWCMKDMPMGEGGKPIYDEADAERAWGKLLALYKAALG